MASVTLPFDFLQLTKIEYSNLAFAFPGNGGGYNSPKQQTTAAPAAPAGYNHGQGWTTTTPAGGAHQTCTTYTVNRAGYVTETQLSTKTHVSTVTVDKTNYIASTVTSTIKAGGLATHTGVTLIPTTAWSTTVITTSYPYSTNVENAAVFVTSVAPVVTQVVVSAKNVVETCYPTTVYEVVTGYTTVKTNIPVATTTCGGSNYGWRF
jgi:hypothetical protein